MILRLWSFGFHHSPSQIIAVVVSYFSAPSRSSVISAFELLLFAESLFDLSGPDLPFLPSGIRDNDLLDVVRDGHWNLILERFGFLKFLWEGWSTESLCLVFSRFRMPINCYLCDCNDTRTFVNQSQPKHGEGFRWRTWNY